MARSMEESSKPYPLEPQLHLPGLFLNAIQAAVIATDLSGAVIYWNPFAQAVVWLVAGRSIGPQYHGNHRQLGN